MMEIRIFDNGHPDWVDDLERALDAQCKELGIHHSVVRTHSAPLLAEGAVLYLAGKPYTPDPAVEEDIKRYLATKQLVLPVLDSGHNASSKLPGLLAGINAFQLDQHGSHWSMALVDEVLSSVWLRRRARRIFISYRRIDSRGIADQLHEYFSHRGFDVFLDDYSIHRGDDFQSELFWWLNDADAVLLLASPRFDRSTWTMAEVTFASSASIGLLGVRWPLATYGGAFLPEPAAFDALYDDQQLRLQLEDFESTLVPPDLMELKPAAIDKIAGLVMRSRVRAIRRRLADLLPYARHEFARKNLQVLDGARLGDFQLTDDRGRAIVARVMPFRPTIDDVHAFSREAASMVPCPDDVGCFYAENDLDDQRVKTMEWALEAERPNVPKRHLWWPYTGRRTKSP